VCRGIIDAIYWRLHASFLLNERSEAEKFLALLEDESSRKDELVLSEIGPVHMGRFRTIRERVRTGSFGRLYGDGIGVPRDQVEFVSEDQSEDEVHRWLYGKDGSSLLLACIGASWESIMCSEVVMGEYGRCDILVRDGRTVYPVEIKAAEAPSSVVSQIDRYRLAMELDFCLGLYDKVIPVVVAGDFGPYVRQELSRCDVSMVCHEGKSLRRLA
jgi:hypothetical protein